MYENKSLITSYYDNFNKKDWDALTNLLDENVIHDRNQENRVLGKEAFKQFLLTMGECYDEQISNLTILQNTAGNRLASEFTVTGTYIKTDINLPPATGQKYTLAAGAFFEIKYNKIARITGYYNLNEWLNLIKE